MCTFITGASGIVGSHLLINLLQTNTENIRVLIRNEKSINQIRTIFSYYTQNTDEWLNQLTFIQGDVLDRTSLYEGMNGAQYVYHCAALVSFDAKDKDQMFKTNIEGTKNVVDIAIKCRIEKLCYVSSIAAIGYSKTGGLISEKDEWEANEKASTYSVSKHLSELEVWKGIEQGLNAVMVNPSMIVGPGQWGNSSTTFFPMINRGMYFYPTGGTGFVDVRDVVDIMVLLMHSPIHSERFIVAAENMPFQHFFNLIADAFGKTKPMIKITPLIGKLSYWAASVLNIFLKNKLPITPESIERAGVTNYFDHAKVKKALNFSFRSVQEAVVHTADCFKAGGS